MLKQCIFLTTSFWSFSMDFLYSSIAVCIFSTSWATLVRVLPMLATVCNKKRWQKSQPSSNCIVPKYQSAKHNVLSVKLQADCHKNMHRSLKNLELSLHSKLQIIPTATSALEDLRTPSAPFTSTNKSHCLRETPSVILQGSNTSRYPYFQEWYLQQKRLKKTKSHIRNAALS